MTVKCFLDLDGVLTDFVGGACRRHDRLDPYADGRNGGEWGIEKLLGLDPAAFWSPLGWSFWSGLDWTPDGRAILAAVEAEFGKENVCLLTSPCDTIGCLEGKRDWIDRHVPGYRRRVLYGSAKEFCAGAGRVLVDDHDGNVDRFEEHGGVAVLVHRPWNRGHAVGSARMLETLPATLRCAHAVAGRVGK